MRLPERQRNNNADGEQAESYSSPAKRQGEQTKDHEKPAQDFHVRALTMERPKHCPRKHMLPARNGGSAKVTRRHYRDGHFSAIHFFPNTPVMQGLHGPWYPSSVGGPA
jgi:hypothetical protein